MRRLRSAFCLFMILALFLITAADHADAVDPVYFTAVNDTLLDLSDATMPFWSGSQLYVPYSVLANSNLGLFYSGNENDNTTIVVYNNRGALVFDPKSDTIYDRQGMHYSGSVINSGGIIFLPVDPLCVYFGLTYNHMRSRFGYLVRIKSDAAVLSDEAFMNAADTLMSSRYAQYLRSHTQSAAEDPPPVSSPSQQTVTQPRARIVYPIIEVTNTALAESLLDGLSPGQDSVSFLFSADTLASSDDLLRHLVATGQSVILKIEGTADPAEALDAIGRANDALWLAATYKTRLVVLDGASAETLRAVKDAGYCPIGPIDYSGQASNTARVNAVKADAERRGIDVKAYIGADGAVLPDFEALLSALRASGFTALRLTEVAA